jgi:diadenosine tetraphosphate (Ap4A) HIT family hydrolase
VSTAIHRRVAALNAGLDEAAIARVPSGWVVLADPQVRLGYCLLLPDPVVTDLNALSAPDRQQFLSDMAAIGDVLLAELSATRVNYAIYGNLEPALHAHIFPRRQDEPAAVRTAQPWALDWQGAEPFSVNRHAPLLDRLRRAVCAAVPGAWLPS